MVGWFVFVFDFSFLFFWRSNGGVNGSFFFLRKQIAGGVCSSRNDSK